jgi:hypothetical protein
MAILALLYRKSFQSALRYDERGACCGLHHCRSGPAHRAARESTAFGAALPIRARQNSDGIW